MLASLKNLISTSKFKRDEDGSIIVFVMVVFSIMMMVGGAAVDLSRYEHTRSTLQYNLDRAVLAAASLQQQQDPEAVVQDYMSRIVTNEPFEVSVQSNVADYSRSVTATATAEIPMWFLSMAGISDLDAKVRSSAQEQKSNIEISLVLDVSGSMGSNSRLTNLKVAAKEFVDILLADIEPDSVAISIIPFNSNTAPSRTMFDLLNVDQVQDLTTCLDFTDEAFSQAALNPSVEQDHAVFTSYYGSFQNYHLPSASCNDEEYFEILPYASNATALHTKIDSLQAAGNTAGHVGIKWGLSLLDPVFEPVVDGLIAAGDVAPGLTRLPVAYADNDTSKIIVMMSDGANTTEFRLGDQYNQGESDLFEVSSGLLGNLSQDFYLRSADGTQYFDIDAGNWIAQSVFDNLNNTLAQFQGTRRLDWPEAWGHMSTNYYRSVMNDWGPSNDFVSGTARTGNEADPLMLDTCEAAANEGVTVYTIGFEMDESSAETLRDCASSISHFYDANGTQISEVFSAIANSILKLKLTQ